jgi:hypothetical protein
MHSSDLNLAYNDKTFEHKYVLGRGGSHSEQPVSNTGY